MLSSPARHFSWCRNLRVGFGKSFAVKSSPAIRQTEIFKAGASHLTPNQASCLSRWCGIQPTALCFRDLLENNMPGSARHKLHSSLRTELCIRLSRSIVLLEALPSGLSYRRGIIAAIDLYIDSLREFEQLTGGVVLHGALLSTQKLHSSVMKLVLHETHAHIAGQTDAGMHATIDESLNRFFANHISIGFLLKHLIQSQKRPTGALQANCTPSSVAKHAAKMSQDICTKAIGRTPEIEIRIESPSEALLYDPDRLCYVLLEIFKNSVRATVELSDTPNMAPVVCIVSSQDEHISIKIKDQGGGIPQDMLSKLFSYTASSSENSALSMHPADTQKALAGFGVGLKLSSLQMQYFGGDLSLETTYGQGTQVCLRLERSPNRKEKLFPTSQTHSTLGGASLLDSSETVLLQSSFEAPQPIA